MAEDKKSNSDVDIVMDGMPGADPITEEEAKSFEVDLNFDEEAPTEDVVEEETPETEEVEEVEEEVEFPTEEEVVEEVEEEDADDTEDTED